MLIGTFGRGFAADTIADGVDVFGGSFEEFVDGDASFFVFDAGVFETKINVGETAGGKGDFFDADHFFGGSVAEDDIFAGGILSDSDSFAVIEDVDA